MSFLEKFVTRSDTANSLLCVGLDTQFDRLPQEYRQADLPQFEFNRWIIDQTQAYAAAYKINTAFYEARGSTGLRELQLTVEYLRSHYADIPTICDAKRADIGSTSEAYAAAVFDVLGFDAVTLHPYLGRDALEPFLSRTDRGCIILCRTSNAGAGELQDLLVDGKPLWMVVAEKTAREWNSKGNCLLVVGATYPDEMRRIRAVVGEMTLLVPGVGTQGGDIEAVMRAGLNHAGKGLIINASRAVIFAPSPADAARELCAAINRYRQPGDSH